jgi:hypothetical protein
VHSIMECIAVPRAMPGGAKLPGIGVNYFDLKK